MGLRFASNDATLRGEGSGRSDSETASDALGDRLRPDLINKLRSMSGMKHKDFGERLSAAKDAKQAMAAKFLQRPGFDDPAVVERRAARAAVSAARDARIAEREAERLAEHVRVEAERVALAEAQAVQDERAAAEKELSDARIEAERKAARDARYASRKARK